MVMVQASSLRVTEIFYSLQGEARTVGKPTVFVRLTGCPLRCRYCDSAYAFEGGSQIAIDEIRKTISGYECKTVTVTGGEPLAQPAVLLLMRHLCDDGYAVSIETSGALPIDAIDVRVSIVLDIKTPGSGEDKKNLYESLAKLKFKDQVKFVICDRQDYEWAKTKLIQFNLLEAVEDVFFSVSYEELSPTDLADWVLADRLQVRVQMQLHKLLWGDLPGH
jgi:7-carboxy-7-deazaguanine synthase